MPSANCKKTIMYTNIYQGPKMSQNHKLWFVSIQCRKSNKVYV